MRHGPMLAVGVMFAAVACAGDPDADRPSERTAVTLLGDVAAVDLADVGGRAAHTATTLPDGRIFVAGGCVTDGCTTATTDTFLISADGRTASASAPLTIPRDSHTANVTRDGVVVLAGGYPGEGVGVTASVEIVQPGSGTLATLQLSHGRGGHASALLTTGQVLIVGGWIRSQTYTATVELVDPMAHSVVSVNDLPWAADALDATALADGSVLVTGGQTAPGTPTTNAAIYDPGSRTWEIVGPMHVARLKHFSVRLTDGRVLVMGGDIGNDTITDSTEIFDPITRAFSPGPRLAEPRYKFAGAALALDDDRVLVGGGGRSVELVDVRTATSTRIDLEDPSGSFATLNRLTTGDFIAIGGYDDRIDLLRAVTLIPASAVDKIRQTSSTVSQA